MLRRRSSTSVPSGIGSKVNCKRNSKHSYSVLSGLSCFHMAVTHANAFSVNNKIKLDRFGALGVGVLCEIN